MADDTDAQATQLRKQIAALDKAMTSGVLTVEQADNMGRVTYRSYAEMRQARNDASRRLAALDDGSAAIGLRRTRQVVMTGRSGW